MKHFYGKTGKIFLFVISTVFAFLTIACSALCVMGINWGLYENPYEFKSYVNRVAGSSYAAWVLSAEDSGFKSERLDGMNCYYGVIDGKDSGSFDYNSDDIYIYKNFNGVEVPKDAFICDYGIGDRTTFTLNESLLDPVGANNISENYGDIYKTYDIEGIGYDLIGQQAYVYANGEFYPLNNEYYDLCLDRVVDAEGIEKDVNTDSIYRMIWENSVTTEARNGNENETLDMLYIGGEPFRKLAGSAESMEDCILAISSNDGKYGNLSLDYVADLSGIHSELLEIEAQPVILQSISKIGMFQSDPAVRFYTFVCFPNETKLSGSTYTWDFYAQAKALSDTALEIKYLLPVGVAVSFVISVLCWILFIFAAGHKKGVEGIVEGPIEKIPADLAMLIGFIIDTSIIGIVVSFADELGRDAVILDIVISVIGGVLCMLIGFLCTSNVAVNIKLHKFCRNSLCGRIIRLIGRLFSKLHAQGKVIRSTVNWSVRIWIIYAVVTFCEGFGLMACNAYEIMFIWLAEKIVFAVALHVIMFNYAKIKAATIKLASGDTEAQVDLTGMPLFLEEHAKALNEVQAGTKIALEERTKSERMKTELITNVSHDIKTPLTSIINYVDLLSKEKIDNEKAAEYLEVLERQSKRLKKLIEDLIEASKASTGNIQFNMEKINAQVLLNQSIGEFEERLESGDIKIVTSFPGDDLYLTADSRYLWRVFDNLMSNIVKYAQPGTRCYVELKEAGGRLEFSFRNTSKEELNISADELMERFVRGDKSRFTDGNGLGLSIAKSLTDSMNGQMNISIDGDLFKVILEFNKAE